MSSGVVLCGRVGLLLGALVATHVQAQLYTVPQPLIEALYPKGLRVSIPDSDDVQLFAFHGNVNKPLYNLEAGEMSVDITRKTNGRWVYHNPQRRLKAGDTINFWLYVQVEGRGYRLDDQSFQVTELIDPDTGLAITGPFSSGTSPKEPHPTGNVQRPSETEYQPRPPPHMQRPTPDTYRPPAMGQRPPTDEYRPPPDEYRPPPDEYRPPPDEYRPPPDEYRPPDSRPPPDDYQSLLPTNENRPYNRPTGNRPPPEYRPPPTDGVYRPNYPPPPPPSSTGDLYIPPSSVGTSNPVHHNHHVGFAESGSSEDRNPNRPVGSNPSVISNRPIYNEVTTPNALTSDRFSVPPKEKERDCELSATTVRGKPACKGEVVFEEKWSTLDLKRWAHEVKISGHPDFEFCVYAQHPENSWVRNGQLHLKPTLTNDKYGADFIRKGKLQLDDCTAGLPNSDSCWREAMFSYILPPTLAARLNSKRSFSFKYGIIEVRAKLPEGDWIYPEIWLQPLDDEYGPGLSSGRILLAMARGNRNLRGAGPQSSNDELSGRHLVVGALAGGKGGGSASAKRKFFYKHSDRGFWGDQFHNYTLLWTPETLAFSVDGLELGVVRPGDNGLGELLRYPNGMGNNEEDPWTRGAKIAPFDKEFYISLGIAVGGVHAFPDGCRSNGVEKPWKNTGAKAMLNFWNAKDQWYPTWSEKSRLLIDSVRVTALNN